MSARNFFIVSSDERFGERIGEDSHLCCRNIFVRCCLGVFGVFDSPFRLGVSRRGNAVCGASEIRGFGESRARMSARSSKPNPHIGGDGGTVSNNLYFDSAALAERDGRVRNTRYMGVNFRQRFAVSYCQVLEFDANGIVVSQRVARTIDGW